MMNYKVTLDWLFNQLPMYQKEGAKAYKKDLSNTLLLMDYLEHPEKELQAIHVAGTNGKGSTSHMLASILQEQGYKVGLYTSPHLVDFRERIKINGQEITENYIIDFIEQHRVFFQENSLSFFEMTVGLAFQYFKTEKVDYVVLETGLGGRLDSTNVVNPLVSVITNIGLDHTQFLGDTLPLIANEKAGIIKKGEPVVIGEFHEETYPVFKKVANLNSSKIYNAFELTECFYVSDLKGDYQQHNIKTALQTIKVLQKLNIKIDDISVKKGLSNVVKNTGLLGRYQITQECPKVICDTAHNKEGLSLVMQQVVSEKHENLHIVFGVVDDKDLDIILTILPKNAICYFTKPSIKRGLSEVVLKNKAESRGLKGGSFASVKLAVQSAISNSNTHDLIYIGGSTFVVADYLESLTKSKN